MTVIAGACTLLYAGLHVSVSPACGHVPVAHAWWLQWSLVGIDSCVRCSGLRLVQLGAGVGYKNRSFLYIPSVYSLHLARR